MQTAEAIKAEETLIHVLWINAGLSCDGDSVALTAATQPSIEEIALGALPGLPQVAVHWPLIDFECGPNGGADDFLEWFFKADRGELEPFVLVVVNKTDLLPYVDFDTDRLIADARKINPEVQVLPVSAKTGDGLDTWLHWLI